MIEALQSTCELFIRNRDAVKHVFRMENSHLYPICANILTAQGKEADESRLEECKRLIKEKTGIFSNFRGNVFSPVAVMLAAGDDPRAQMDRALEHYDLLKKYFWGSGYLALVAFLLTDLPMEGGAETYIARGRALYDRMRKEHPFLTSTEDSVFAVLMAWAQKTDDQLIEDMETCFHLLRDRFFDRNSIQSASHVLALGEGWAEEKAERVIALYDALRNSGRNYGKNYELSTLAAVALLDRDTARISLDILDADAFLKQQKGYGIFGPGKRARLMHAAMIVSDRYTPRANVETAAVTGTIAMIAAQQAAMCSAIASTSAAASSSHAGG